MQNFLCYFPLYHYSIGVIQGIKRINCEIPKSTTAKKIAKNPTVIRTVIVELVNSLRFGQLTLRISRATSLKKFKTRCMSETSNFHRDYLYIFLTLFPYGLYERCMFCKTSSALTALHFYYS